MGVDIDAKLIFGYAVSYEKLNKYLIDLKIGSCLNEPGEYTKQCYCGKCCWNLNLLPKGIHIIQAHPYYDCSNSECNYFISLLPSGQYKLSDIKKITDEQINSLKEFAKQFMYDPNIELGEPKIMAVPNVW
jgi:hypothetical protein